MDLPTETVRLALRRLFPTASHEQLAPAEQSVRWRTLGEGEVVVAEGDQGEDVFVVCSGRYGVYARNALGAIQLMTTIDTVADVVGEQSLLSGSGLRNATIVTLVPGVIGILDAEPLRELLSGAPDTRQRLAAGARTMTANKLRILAAELSSFADGHSGGQPRVRHLEAGEQAYSAGDQVKSAFFILSGDLQFFHPGCPMPHESAGAGMLVGERTLLDRKCHQVNAVARVATELLELDAEALRICRANSTAIDQMLVSLSIMEDMPRIGSVKRHLETSGGTPCIVSQHQLERGASVRVRQYPQQQLTIAGSVDSMTEANATITSPDGRSVLVLEEKSGQLLGVAAPQDWSQLPEAMGLLFRGQSLTPLQIDAFQATGEFLVEDATIRVSSGAEVVCGCTNTTSATLRAAAQGASTVEDLMRRTGAGTVCGGCRGRLKAIIEQSEGQLCRLQTAPLAVGSLLATLTPAGDAGLPKGRPGQHARIEALIDGRWVGRPYTLISSAEHRWELGVKIEADGLFSNWISQASPGTVVRVSRPEGTICPSPTDAKPLVYVVAGIGVTPAVAGVRGCRGQRNIRVIYSYRSAAAAPFLQELRDAAVDPLIELIEHDTATSGRLDPADVAAQLTAVGPCDVIVCGPAAFNTTMLDALRRLPGVELHAESFHHPNRGEGSRLNPGQWRVRGFKPRHPVGEPLPIGSTLPPEEQAAQFLREYHAECHPDADPSERIAAAVEQLRDAGAWRKTPEELGFAARLAWRNAARCVGRLYWQGLHLHDCRDLRCPDTMAAALLEHLRFAFNGGELRPAITVFDPGTNDRPGPRIWNSQLLRYAGVRLRSGKQIGDSSNNELTDRIRALGWEPQGDDFELLPLVIETIDHGPRLYELPADCRQEVPISHATHPWLATMELKWHAVPAVSDMALDAGGMFYRFAPFNGWYLNTEIAARNLTDTNRYNLLPRIAERMGLDILDDRNLWRDKSLVMLNEALLQSFDRAGVKMADHHQIGREFLEFCRAEQQAGREPHGRWMWLVPPVSSSTSVLYQEGFRDVSLKPAYRNQKPIWNGRPRPGQAPSASDHPAGAVCPLH